MAHPPLSAFEIARTRQALSLHNGNQVRAAAELGISRSAIQGRLRAMERIEAAEVRQPETEVQVAPPPDPNEPIESLLARKRAGVDRALAHEKWAHLIPVDVKARGPIGVLLVGDPHVDDDHCDIQALERDLSAVGRTPGFFAGHLGDLTNNWVGRLAKLYAAQSTTFQDGLRLTEWMLGLAPNLFVVNGNHDCHDAQTEALTRRGWVNGLDVCDDDEVMTLNLETGEAEWNPVEGRIVRDHVGEMVRTESRSISALVTPNHRVLHATRSSEQGYFKNWGYCEAKDHPSMFAYRVSAVEKADGCGLSEDQIRLAGWVLTDGRVAGGRVTLYQSKDTTEIERLLKALGLTYRHSVRQRDITHVCGRKLKAPSLPAHEFVLDEASSSWVMRWVPERGRLPDWTNLTTAAEFDALLDAIVAGDGTWDGADPEAKRCAVVYKNKAFLDGLQALALRRGWSARIHQARENDFRLDLCRREALKMYRQTTVTTEAYSGKVWCLTVRNSNFLVRREGSAHFSGNCWNQGADLLRFVVRAGVHQSHGARMALRWPGGREIRLHARHDFPGRSQYSSTHGMKREVLFGHRDHVIVAGHIHCDEARVEPAVDGDAHWFFRVSGYKVIDEYAKTNHFRPARLAPSVAVVIDPEARVPADVVKPFWDVEHAADYLTFCRKGIK